MTKCNPILFRDASHQVFFNLCRGIALRETKPPGNASAMSVHNNGRHAVQFSGDQIRDFPADSGEPLKFLLPGGDLSAEFSGNHP